VSPPPILAIEPTGAVAALDPTSLTDEATLATSVIPNLGIAVRPELDLMYVTADDPDGELAVWAAPLTACHGHPKMVEQDAELPSVSPDGGFLGFVTLDAQGHQSGVGVVRLGPNGDLVGAVRRYPATSTPPPLPITGVAVGGQDATLAVWGGFVDPYLGPSHPTTGTLDPSTATSLAALTPVFDERGISIPARVASKPEDWQSSPVFLPAGELLAGDGSRLISLLAFAGAPPGSSGDGDRVIVRNSGPVISLASGEDGSLVFVSSHGRLTMAVNAVDLPFGPGAETPPEPPPAERTAPGHFTAVAWTEGPAAESTPLPRVYQMVNQLPNVVGLSLGAATSLLNGLDLPVMVLVNNTVVEGAPSTETVLAQSPPAGVGMGCQCSVGLTVSSAT